MNQENWQGINIKGGNNTINNPQFHLPPKPITPSKSIPYQGTPHFVGRQWELASLHQTLQKWDRVAISAVAGMGGVGKTELAIKCSLSSRRLPWWDLLAICQRRESGRTDFAICPAIPETRSTAAGLARKSPRSRPTGSLVLATVATPTRAGVGGVG